MRPRSKQLFLAFWLSLLSIFAVGGTVFASPTNQQSQFVAPILVANSSFLNVRTGPGVQYSVLITVVGGTELPVLGVASDKVWYQVSTLVGVGWANVQFTLPRGDFSKVPIVDAPPVAPGLVVQGNNSVAQLGQGGGGAPAPVTANTPRTTTSLLWGVSVLGGDFLTAPSSNAQRILVAMGENRIEIYPLSGSQFSEGRLWLQFTIPGTGSGWDEAHQLFIRPLICPGSGLSAAILTQTTSAIGGPGGAPVPQGTFQQGQEVYVLNTAPGIVQIGLVDGTTAWVPINVTQGRDESKVSPHGCEGVVQVQQQGSSNAPGTTVTNNSAAPASLQAPHVVINTGFINIRSGPGSQYSVVATVSGGTELPVIGIASDNVWFLVQGPFGQGWVNNQFVLFRGSIDSVPVIKNATGTLATPTASINGAITLYAAPNPSLGTVGAISGPVVVPVVARNNDFSWVQISTSIGFGWVPVNQVVVQGDTSLIPVVGQ